MASVRRWFRQQREPLSLLQADDLGNSQEPRGRLTAPAWKDLGERRFRRGDTKSQPAPVPSGATATPVTLATVGIASSCSASATSVKRCICIGMNVVGTEMSAPEQKLRGTGDHQRAHTLVTTGRVERVRNAIHSSGLIAFLRRGRLSVSVRTPSRSSDSSTGRRSQKSTSSAPRAVTINSSSAI